MKNLTPLNDIQRDLVAGGLPVVHWAIRKHIIVNEQVYGFSYDDLYQEGCLWLCKAALTFDESKAVKFETYAQTVVTNGLRTYCRLMCNKQKRQTLISDPIEKDTSISMDQLTEADPFAAMISEMDTLSMLGSLKTQYQGTARLGIEAIELKVKGFSGTEIAAMYGVKPTLVGAWIHRAAQKLRQNEMFLSSLSKDSLKKHLAK